MQMHINPAFIYYVQFYLYSYSNKKKIKIIINKL
jgi:hypothetical protein